MVKTDIKCGRTACDSADARCWNAVTQKFYCVKCARKINEATPGLCVMPTREQHAAINDTIKRFPILFGNVLLRKLTGVQ